MLKRCFSKEREPAVAMVQIVNYLLYQIGWLACIGGVALGDRKIGMLVAFGLIGAHLWLATDRRTQLTLMLITAFVGLIVDSTLISSGAVWFPFGSLISWMPPFFMTVLWMQFATTFQYCMRWLSGRYWMSSLLAGFGAPLAFAAGERLGVIGFYQPRALHFAFLGGLWAVAIPALIYASDRLSRFSKVEATYRWPCTGS